VFIRLILVLFIALFAKDNIDLPVGNALSTVGASSLAMVVNDEEVSLDARDVPASIASELAPTGNLIDRSPFESSIKTNKRKQRHEQAL